jgi:hypothetical protein
MFWALPDKTLTMKNDKCFGRKIPKQRLTVLLCSNILSRFTSRKYLCAQSGR